MLLKPLKTNDCPFCWSSLRNAGVAGSSPASGTTFSQVSGRHLSGSHLRSSKCQNCAGFRVDRSTRPKRADGLEWPYQSDRDQPSQRVTSRPPLHVWTRRTRARSYTSRRDAAEI
jgi:hypothetical protein